MSIHDLSKSSSDFLVLVALHSAKDFIDILCVGVNRCGRSVVVDT